jgi:hypothetical protein
MKLTSQLIMMNFEHEVTVGDLTATLVAQVCTHNDKPADPEIEFMDIINIKYRGVDIIGYENWKKFRDFHFEMGISYSEILDQEFEKVFTKEAICRELGHGK